MTLRFAFALAIVLLLRPAFGEGRVPTWRSFAEAVTEIDDRYAKLQQSNLGELKLLRQMPEFIDFSRYSDEYAEDCIAYLGEPSHSLQERTIALLSMRTLSLDKFIWFANRLLDLNADHKVSNLEVMDGLDPPNGFSTIMFRNSLDRRIRRVLYRMKSMESLDSIYSNNINEYLYGGKYLKFLYRSYMGDVAERGG